MIELTVRTLDSQNHQFTVEDEITVEQFKVKIADTVNIPAETQRIIYCGRVLQDTAKLSDYDVNGKVVHLVQRPPPSTTARSNSRSSSPLPHRRVYRPYRGLEQGNAMYLGSMAFPGNLMESQGIVPPPPTHSLSGSRLNVAKRMLRRAGAVIQLLENPGAGPQEQNTTEENQEEEVTPVIEARVIVPNNNEPIDEVLHAVQDTLMNATGATITLDRSGASTSSAEQPAATDETLRSPNQSENSTPGGPTPRSNSSENLTGDQRPENNTNLPENASRTSEMAELLTLLAQLQTRFAPFLERYQNFMQEDPEIPHTDHRHTQVMLNRVSEVLHYLGHAYHSLSDIIIRVCTAPPRALLCRPILIQHSAVVQTGIPIQVEAQINLSADRMPPATTGTSGQTQSAPTTSSTTNATPAAAATAPNTTASGNPSISVQSGFVSLPFLPGVRVQSFPVEVRTVRPNRPQNNNNNNTVPPPPPSENNEPANGETPQEPNQNNEFNFNNPNVEFYMEVTPEGITLDSLEATLIDSNQANDLLRGALNGPPPQFLQSLMQMAGHIINRNIATSSSTDQSQSTQQPNNTQPTVGQNSQARGNTQTNPTTATSTRSTPRPHVHLAQQAMQGGFDPFLPCNSHHISRRRVHAQHNTNNASTNTSNNQGTQSAAPAREAATSMQRNPLSERIHLGNLFSQLNQATRSMPVPVNSNASGSASGDNQNPGLTMHSLFSALLSNSSNTSNSEPTLEEILQQFQRRQQDYQYVPGTSIITDLIMLLVRNLTFTDVITLVNGNIEPISRSIPDIQTFVRTRICDQNTSPSGINAATERLITEMQPFLEQFSSMPVRDNIDIVRSAQELFRQRLPEIIRISINLTPDMVRPLFDQCVSTAKQLLALTLLASVSGPQGVLQIYEQLMNRVIQDMSHENQHWSVMASSVQLRQVLNTLNVPESVVRPYIILRQETAPVSSNAAVQEEAMELDVAESTNEQLASPVIVLDDAEPLPDIVLGSETWHNQVPEDWVPIISRDSQKQRRQNSQEPFSNAYLSGMPSKRRKLINSSKPQGSLPKVITDGVRQAVSATGLASVAPLETVAQLAGASPEIQNTYRNLFRSTVQSNLRENEDFTPERFPNASKYFNPQR